MKELIEAIAKALMNNLDQVQARAIEGEQITAFELRVHSGRTVDAIRTIPSAAGMKLRKRFVLEILDWCEELTHSVRSDPGADS